MPKKYLPHLRSPRTQQEMRKYYDALDQGYKPRAKRSPRYLPNAWDDIPVRYGSYQKRTQWPPSHNLLVLLARFECMR